MSSSKSPISTDVKVPCITCGRECPDGLRYCLYCGGKTLELDKPVMPMNPHCVECGENDELNYTFCVACGAKLLTALDSTGTGFGPGNASGTVGSSSGDGPRLGSGPGAASGSGSVSGSPSGSASGSGRAGKFRRNTGFNWTTEMTPPQGNALKIPGVLPQQKTSVATLPALMPVAAGVAAGLLIAGALFSVGFSPDLFDRATWPKSGLVVYCPIVDMSSTSGAARTAGSSGVSKVNGTTSSARSIQIATSAGEDTSGAKNTSGTSSDTSGDSAGDAGSASASSGDDSKASNVSGSSDDDNKPAGAGTVGSAGETSNSGTAVSDSAKGSDHPETGGSWQLSLENLSSHQLTISPLVPSRSLLGRRMPGCLIFKDLAAGDYMLRIQRTGASTTLGLVTLIADKPTVIGYPNGMRLPI